MQVRKKNVQTQKEDNARDLLSFKDYDPWTDSRTPSDTAIKNCATNPNLALGTFRVMLGIPGDRRIPQDLSFTYNKEQIYRAFITNAGHEAPIRLCGVCGILNIMTDGEFHILEVKHRKIQFLQADEEQLGTFTKLRRDSMHLSNLDEKTYHIHRDALDKEDKTVAVCHSCFLGLDYAINTSNVPPRQTFKSYDVGSIPSYLPDLSLLEVLSICRALCFHTVFHLRAMGSGVAQQALRGHSICLPLSNSEVESSEQTSLPRIDLAEYVGVVFVGVKKVWNIAKQVTRNIGPLRIKMKNVMAWLHYLQHNGNSYYSDITIPTKVSEKEAIQTLLDNEVNKIIEKASTSDSGMISRLVREVRGEQQFAAEGGEDVEPIEGVSLESIMVTNVPAAEDVETAVITKLNDALNHSESEEELGSEYPDQDRVVEPLAEINLESDYEIDEKQNSIPPTEEKKETTNEMDGKKGKTDNTIKIQLHNQLLNEYQENHELLSKCFPTLFPLGVSENDLGGGAPMSSIQRKTLLLFYDRRFAKNHNFIFHHFNQEMRRQTNTNVSLRVDRRDARTEDLMRMVNEEDFADNLKIAMQKPKSEEALAIKKKIIPLVKILGANVKWSPFERKATLSRHYGLYHAFGLPFLFGTVSPGMRNSPLALRMCAKHTEGKWSIKDGLQLFPDILLTNIHKRDTQIMQNPVAAAEVFDVIIKAFFSLLMGIPLDHLRGKKSNFDRLLQKNEEEFVGAYGSIRAVYGIIEAQGSGGLHLHFHA